MVLIYSEELEKRMYKYNNKRCYKNNAIKSKQNLPLGNNVTLACHFSFHDKVRHKNKVFLCTAFCICTAYSQEISKQSIMEAIQRMEITGNR